MGMTEYYSVQLNNSSTHISHYVVKNAMATE